MNAMPSLHTSRHHCPWFGRDAVIIGLTLFAILLSACSDAPEDLGENARASECGGYGPVPEERMRARLIEEDDQCCAVEIPHISKGAEIVVAITAEVDEVKLKKQLLENLPPLAIPKKFIYFKELPVMGNGKVNFRAATDMCRTKE